MSDVTIKNLQALCNDILLKREIVDVEEKKVKELNKELDELEHEMLSIMDELKLKNFNENGSLFGTRETYQLATPKGENKDLFFNYLKEIGHFEALATVHSKTLNSWFQQENEAAISRGEPGAMIPGLDLPTKRVSLYIKKTT